MSYKYLKSFSIFAYYNLVELKEKFCGLHKLGRKVPANKTFDTF
jgi:hypothetical protein